MKPLIGGMRICSMGPGDYDKDMLWQGNPLALEWWNQWVASSALGYGPPGHTLVLWVKLPEGNSHVHLRRNLPNIWISAGLIRQA